MRNKMKVICLVYFIATVFAIIAVMAIAEHLPIVGKPLVVLAAIVLILFIITFFAIMIRRQNK